MRPDGAGAERLSFSDTVDWFPHLSPDGSKAVYLAYPPGTAGHPADKPVELMLVTDGRWTNLSAPPPSRADRAPSMSTAGRQTAPASPMSPIHSAEPLEQSMTYTVEDLAIEQEQLHLPRFDYDVAWRLGVMIRERGRGNECPGHRHRGAWA